MKKLEFEKMRTASDVYIAQQNSHPLTHLRKTCNYLRMKLNKKLMENLEKQDPLFKNRLESMILHIELGTKMNLNPAILQNFTKYPLPKRFDFREWLSEFCKENGYDLNVTTDFIALDRHIRENKKIFMFLSNKRVPIGHDLFYNLIYNLVCNET